MLPLGAIPATIRTGLAPYREVFCCARGFEQIDRYLSDLILSPNKTFQGIYSLQSWGQASLPSHRAMHAAVFEAPWDTAPLLARHCAVIAPDHRGWG